jgi:hypothetical protein
VVAQLTHYKITHFSLPKKNRTSNFKKVISVFAKSVKTFKLMSVILMFFSLIKLINSWIDFKMCFVRLWERSCQKLPSLGM